MQENSRRKSPSAVFALHFLFVEMLNPLNALIQDHGDHAQNDNRSNHHIQLEEMESADDKGKCPKEPSPDCLFD